jgi:hypothetical protein
MTRSTTLIPVAVMQSPKARAVARIQYHDNPNPELHPEFKNYDIKAISQIEKNWYDLVDKLTSATDFQPGEVIISFELYSDGSISDTKVVKSNVDERETKICQMAISNAVFQAMAG